MTDTMCEALLDRMPEVAAGRGSWTPDEARHLDECADCGESWRLLAAAHRLGTDVEAAYDPTVAIAAVGARLRAARRPQWQRPRVLVALAAAAALVLVALPRLARGPAAEGAVTEEALFLSELDSLTTTELAVIEDEMLPPLSEVANPDPAPLLDLDSTQLERVLRSLEG